MWQLSHGHWCRAEGGSTRTPRGGSRWIYMHQLSAMLVLPLYLVVAEHTTHKHHKAIEVYSTSVTMCHARILWAKGCVSALDHRHHTGNCARVWRVCNKNHPFFDLRWNCWCVVITSVDVGHGFVNQAKIVICILGVRHTETTNNTRWRPFFS